MLFVQADVIGARYAASCAHKRSAAGDSADNADPSCGTSDGANATLLGPSGTSPFAVKHVEVGAADPLYHRQLPHTL